MNVSELLFVSMF